ncbi:MarR family transcriptional regulator [Acuticoccus sp. M5D2P5]|uniref:MarR family winged helix-turn-helix transcriptional regulator n=1 Tax=Acuticoccus kalidii TaxID=2910977 RepID=UPI001F43851F|nr:MarR family transcriptional regulator [Acuticoccus kalidii]MCF3934508.1 MarR family transcriptional regulator [Acuticoccus kalidii]
MFCKTTSAGYLANHCARLFVLAFAARIQPFGLVAGQFPVLLELWDTDGLTQKELVERTDVEQATMANTLARMERDGLIRRTPHPSDRRAQLVWLSDRAKMIKDPVISAAIEQNDIALGRLSDAEQELFIALLRRVVDTLRAERPRARERQELENTAKGHPG